MRPAPAAIFRIAAALSVAAMVPACVGGAAPVNVSGVSLGGDNYAPQYDFSEFWAATDGRLFRVVFAGNPFPRFPVEEVKQRLLPVLQANRPRPALTFTYAAPAEEQHPDYRLVLVFDPANDLGSGPVCNGVTRFKPRAAAAPDRVYVYGVYCRNDLALSETTGWTSATSPDDPRMGALFSQLFLVLFTDRPMRRRFVPIGFW